MDTKRAKRWRSAAAHAAAILAGVALGWYAWTVIAGAPSHALDVMAVSNVDVRKAFAAEGFGQPGAGETTQPLTWSRPVHSESDALAAVRSLDLSPHALAAAPHVNAVQAQGSIKLQGPVLDNIDYFANALADIWILRQRNLDEAAWRTYAIVQDKTTAPNVAYFLRVDSMPAAFRGESCFECHPSGPRYIRPLRPDLITGVTVADAFNAKIEANGYVAMHFSASEPDQHRGDELTASACVTCHSRDGERAPLYRIQEGSIRALVAIGAMPRDGTLTPAQMAELQAWIDRR